MDKLKLHAEKEFSEIQKLYLQDDTNDYLNSLIMGQFGTGKTVTACTGPGPILIHSFDPGGTKSVRHLIDEGIVIADTRFEREEIQGSPLGAYSRWEKEFHRLKRAGVFEKVGTYVIDSFTTMSDSLLREIAKKEKRQDLPPQLQDYNLQIHVLKHMMREIASLPCHFVCTGHITMDKDEVTGRMVPMIMATGKLKEKIPLLFDEVYIARVQKSSSGPRYELLTQSDGFYQARSRLAAGKKLKPTEEPNIKDILKKAGMPYEDKTTNTNK